MRLEVVNPCVLAECLVMTRHQDLERMPITLAPLKMSHNMAFERDAPKAARPSTLR